ncbi:Pentatricopeptide repeat-containing protein [Abeliophyllum distichum]|uniref:Pentatricopeptide repeat-containing protein n=1 Tax=Abeliophyllum distichum TaxID=126358 RepID=A0ABD1PFY3_9LAMI
MATAKRKLFSLLPLTQTAIFIPKSHSTIPSSQPIYSKPDDKMLFHILESCKLFPNFRTAVAVHNKIIKHGYGMYPSLLSLLVLVYVSCEQINLARQLLGETCSLDCDVVAANMVITSFMKIGEIDIAKKLFSCTT